MLKNFFGAAAIIAAMAFVAPSMAQTVTVGDAHPAGTYDCTPFCTPVIQTAYGASYFGSAPISINSIGLYLTDYATQDFTFTLSTSANAVGNLSTTFADNISNDAKTFFSGSLPSTTDADGFTIFSGTPFTYDPTKGDLLLQVTSNESTYNGASAYQGSEGGGSSAPTERVFSFNPGSATGEKETAGYGFDTKFGLSTPSASAVPEPTTWAMMILGMGAIGASARSAKRRSDQKFNAKIKRISNGALA